MSFLTTPDFCRLNEVAFKTASTCAPSSKNCDGSTSFSFNSASILVKFSGVASKSSRLLDSTLSCAGFSGDLKALSTSESLGLTGTVDVPTGSILGKITVALEGFSSPARRFKVGGVVSVTTLAAASTALGAASTSGAVGASGVSTR